MKEHKWYAVIGIPLDKLEVAEWLKNGHFGKQLAQSDIEMQGLGCLDCELEANEAWGKPCIPGPDTIKLKEDE